MKRILFILVIIISLCNASFSQEKIPINPENFGYANDSTVTTSAFDVYDSLHIAIQISDTVNVKIYWERSALGSIWASDSVSATTGNVLQEKVIRIIPTTGIMYGRLKFVFQLTGNDTQGNGRVRVYRKEWK